MKDFKKLPKMACGGRVKRYNTGGMATIEGMYVPEKETAQMFVPKKEQTGGMPTITPSKKSEEFNLHKIVKKAADKSGLKRGGKVKK